MRDMLANAWLIIRESQRHGGAGWLDYDRVFRQQAALDASMRWNTLDPSIQASTLVSHAPSHTLVCGLCREPDHMASQCALAYLQPLKSPASHADPTARVLCARMSARRPESQAGVCISWNTGRCTFPGQCRFRHICATCHQPHMAQDCSVLSSYSEGRPQGGGAHQETRRTQ